jgi:hypothetical protein
VIITAAVWSAAAFPSGDGPLPAAWRETRIRPPSNAASLFSRLWHRACAWSIVSQQRLDPLR